MSAQTIDLLNKNHTWLKEELKQENAMDRTNIFCQTRIMLRIKSSKTNAALNLLQQNVSATLAHSQKQKIIVSRHD